jgi:uncharacterized protein (DUF1684 family)
MHFRNRSAGLTLIALFIALLPAAATSQETSWQKELTAWRTQYVAGLLKPDGWLSLIGLEWLQPGDNSVGSAADNKIHLAAGNPAHLAILHLEGESVTLNAPAGGFPPDFLVAGSPAKPQPLRAEANNDKVSRRLTIGTLNMYVIRREGRFALRIKDSHSPSIVGFHGERKVDRIAARVQLLEAEGREIGGDPGRVAPLYGWDGAHHLRRVHVTL